MPLGSCRGNGQCGAQLTGACRARAGKTGLLGVPLPEIKKVVRLEAVGVVLEVG